MDHALELAPEAYGSRSAVGVIAESDVLAMVRKQ